MLSRCTRDLKQMFKVKHFTGYKVHSGAPYCLEIRKRFTGYMVHLDAPYKGRSDALYTQESNKVVKKVMVYCFGFRFFFTFCFNKTSSQGSDWGSPSKKLKGKEKGDVRLMIFSASTSSVRFCLFGKRVVRHENNDTRVVRGNASKR